MSELAPRPSQQDRLQHGLVSLFEMTKTSLGNLIVGIRLLEEIRSLFNPLIMGPEVDVPLRRRSFANVRVTNGQNNIFGGLDMYLAYETFLAQCQTVCMVMEARHTEAFVVEEIKALQDNQHYTILTAMNRIEDVLGSLRREIATRAAYVPGPEEISYYRDKLPPEMAAIEAMFPSVQVDFLESGRCLALGRTTASVMHLMRALEEPLAKLASLLGVEPGDRDSWGEVLNKVRTAIKLRDTGQGKSGGWKSNDERLFFHSAANSIRHIQIELRDPAFHRTKETFSLDEAKLEYANIKKFLILVAERVAKIETARSDP